MSSIIFKNGTIVPASWLNDVNAVVYQGTLPAGVEIPATSVSANDGSSGSIFTTVQGFITKSQSSSGSSIEGYVQTGTGVVSRFVQDRLREKLSVFDFMTQAQIADVIAGTRTLDVSSAVQAAETAAGLIGALLVYPCGAYRIDTPVTPAGRITRTSDGGGYAGAVLWGNNATAIFSYTSLDDSHTIGLSFGAMVAGCKAFYQTDLTQYTQNCTWTRCNFQKSLTECIYGNLILCFIGLKNAFGYYGSTVAGQTQHRHIYSKGNTGNGNLSNLNVIFGSNRFYNAFGVNESVYIEAARGIEISGGNDFEQNTARALTLAGVTSFKINGNWFENCNSTEIIRFTNDTSNTIGNYTGSVNNNTFNAYGSGVQTIIYGAGNTTINEFDQNTGSGTFTAVDGSSGGAIKECTQLSWGSGSPGTLPVCNGTGSVTPAFVPQGGTITNGSSTGTWWRANGFVDFVFNVTASAVGTPTGSLQVSGLPYLPSVETPVTLYATNFTASASTALMAKILTSGNILVNAFASGTVVNSGNLAPYVQAGTTLEVSGRYAVA